MSAAAVVSRLNLALVVVTVLLLLGALFAPDGRWWGVDVGMACAALFAPCLGLLVWQAGWNPDRVFPADSSLAERRGWVNVFFCLLVLVSFIHFLWAQASHETPPATHGELLIRHFFWYLVVLAIAAGIIQHGLGAQTRGTVALDERDLRIRHAADRAGNTLLSIIVVACVVLLATIPGEHLAWWLAPLIAAHLLIGVLIFKSLAENLWLVTSYARERR